MVKSDEPTPANLTIPQMRQAISKIERRLPELEAFDPNSVRSRQDPEIATLEGKLETLLESIYPPHTTENRQFGHRATSLDTARHNAFEPPPLGEVRQGLMRGKETALHQWKAIVDHLNEEIENSTETNSGRAVQAYEGLELHPYIARAASSLYTSGHYANAIEDAVKALNALVRLASGVDDKDGTHLMEFVFNPKTPILKFNGLADQSDLDEQRGFMMMLSGAVAGLRNPRAHKLIKDDAESALEFIAFVSLLAKIVEKAKR